ncbi:dual specificity protein phosphatase 10 [Pelomyxa schiedti]|nr:dual specificity protein phosphatase 10 [Pelomyxa schiedti]
MAAVTGVIAERVCDDVYNSLLCGQLLVLDVRSRAEFDSCHIVHSFNVPDCSGFKTSGPISFLPVSYFPPQQRLAWRQRTNVLLIDSGSTCALDMVRTCPHLQSLIPIICRRQESSSQLGGDPLPEVTLSMLVGGFQQFSAEYSLLCCSGSPTAPAKFFSMIPNPPGTPDVEAFPCMIVKDFLYLGPMASLTTPHIFSGLKFSHVISVCPLDQPIQDMISTNGITHMSISVEDHCTAQIHPFFQPAFDFVKTAQSNPKSRVLIHCAAGVSRSPTIAIACLMQLRHCNASDALAIVATARPVVHPNTGFLQQLLQLEKQLGFSGTSIEVDIYRTKY